MAGLYVVTGIAVVISAFMSPEKTKMGLKKGWMKFSKTLPDYLKMLMLISVILLISEDFIVGIMSHENRVLGLISSLLIGTITMMPGFIAYPLAKILLSKGVPYMVISGFVTSLMLVGIMTLPLEKKYFGFKGAIIRNIMSFVVALMIAILTGLFYGEVF